MRTLSAAVLLIAAAASAPLHASEPGAAFRPSANGATDFITPSANIQCTFVPAGGTSVYKPAHAGAELSCDRAAPSYVRVTLTGSGPARSTADVGDPNCCGSDNTLAYGATWSRAGFTCTSGQEGLACRRGRHGFDISRAGVRTR